ncbi:MAG: hypothetical protein K2F90_02005 [Clostridiales bacterium]|nr:hypothetical protein [Clostridiales bacterium]
MDIIGENIPVTVTVATETEPTTVSGVYVKTDDGFMLRFSIGTDEFVITHGEAQTEVKAEGVMSYDIVLGEGNTTTTLATPFGLVKFNVKPEMRHVCVTERIIRMLLSYVLSADGVGDMMRKVDVTVEFGIRN